MEHNGWRRGAVDGQANRVSHVAWWAQIFEMERRALLLVRGKLWDELDNERQRAAMRISLEAARINRMYNAKLTSGATPEQETKK